MLKYDKNFTSLVIRIMLGLFHQRRRHVMARMTDKDWNRHEYLQADSLRLAGYLTEDEWYDESCAKEDEAYAAQERASELALTGCDPNYYDPEAQADLALHDFLHPDGYGV